VGAVGGDDTMQVEIIQGKEAIERLRPEWDAIYDADPEAQFFLSWSWLNAYNAPWGRDTFILAVKPDTDGASYVALMPLRLRTKERSNTEFVNEINLAGNYISDYCGFLCRGGFEEQALPALAAKLQQLNWIRLRLEYFCASDRRAELFLSGFSPDTFRTTRPNLVNRDNVDNGICPSVALPDDWDRFLETKVSSNTRQKIRRFLRQVENSDEYRITHANADTLKRDIELMLAHWTERWGARKGKRLPTILDANRAALRNAFAAGTLFMPVLWHGDRAICVLAILVDDRKKTYNFYIGGRDEGFKGPPTGLVLHGYAIRHAIANGITKYDFLRGNEPYKYSFGCEEMRIRSLFLTTRNQCNLGGKIDARSVPVVLERAFELHQAGKLDKAERACKQVLDVDPNNARALHLLGTVVAKRGNHLMAVKHFRHIVSLIPAAVASWFALGKSLQARGAWAEAADAYCELISRQPTHPQVYHNLGQVLLKLDQVDHAVTAFEAALGLKADYTDAIIGRSEALGIRGAISRSKAAQRASRHAAVGERVATIGAISAAARRFNQATVASQSPGREGAGGTLLADAWRPVDSPLRMKAGVKSRVLH
jgi:CelD/BcsL family acetyltransferase involved in cellulose biosynthesis/Tfp pilus assembly protein PilF